MASSVQVRRLLRGIRTPHSLHDDSLANELAVATGAASPREAVLALLERALHDYDPRCRQLVELCDVRGEPGKVAADELHLSERSFYRMRALVVAALERTIAELCRPVPRRAVDLDAVGWYARGQRHLSRRTRSSLDAALKCFDAALAHDPRFARAYAGIAYARLLAAEYAIEDERTAFADAKRALGQARDLDPTLAEVYAGEGDLMLFANRNAARARSLFEAAIGRDTQCASAYQNVAWLALLERRPEVAAASAAEGLLREPASLALQTTLGLALYEGGRSERGQAHLRSILGADPDYVPARFHLGAFLAETGAYAEALALFEALIAEEPRATFVAAAAYARARLGDAKGALAALAAIETQAPRERPPYVYRAIVLGGLGREAGALRELRAAVREEQPWPCTVCLDPFLRTLRGVGDYDSLFGMVTISA
jgi:tetratricopeptide (TPR) repeat protein